MAAASLFLAACLAVAAPRTALSAPSLAHTDLCVDCAHTRASSFITSATEGETAAAKLRGGRRLTRHNPGGDLLWDGGASDNWRDVFNTLNFSTLTNKFRGSGSVQPVWENGYRMWRVRKPASDSRAETRGAVGWNPWQRKVYFVGWRWRMTATVPAAPTLSGGVKVFQWKAYAAGQDGTWAPVEQNYPFAMWWDGSLLWLTKYDRFWQEDRKNRITRIWQAPVAAGQWVSFVLGVKLSRDKRVGHIEVWFNGAKQRLLTGGTRVKHRTMDGGEVAPKWGVYNKASVGTDFTVDLRDMSISEHLGAVQAKLW